MKKVAKSLGEIKPYLQSVLLFFFSDQNSGKLFHRYFITENFSTSVTIAICASISCLIYTQMSDERILSKRYQMPNLKKLHIYVYIYK